MEIEDVVVEDKMEAGKKAVEMMIEDVDSKEVDEELEQLMELERLEEETEMDEK